MNRYIPISAEALNHECPERGAGPGENCHGISAVVYNARIIVKTGANEVGIFVWHDERLPARLPLRVVSTDEP